MSEIDQYDYELPRELIAQHPLACRSDARLLVVDRRAFSLRHMHVRDLPSLLAPDDCLVVNDTRVVPARLVGYRAGTKGRWQGLFLCDDGRGIWKVMGKTRGRLSPGDTIILQDAASRDAVSLRLVSALEDGCWAARPDSDEGTLEILARVGRVPLPPYIRGGEMVESDREAYQTVFGEKPGAVAAPTAGLHFTDGLLQEFSRRGQTVVRITLHVGVGTFRPIKAARLADHRMHSEWGSVSDEVAARLLACRERGGRVVAVGTTSVRVLETAARGGSLQSWQGQTDLFIRPFFPFHCVDALMTNFHLPRSTLLVLVRTFGGQDLIRRAYEEAVREEYRFYSYGDAMLIF